MGRNGESAKALVNRTSDDGGRSASTSLESIAEKLEQSRTDNLEQILMRSGSTASQKNDYGITVVDDNAIASSLVFKSINRPKLDKDEVVKAIDVEITELKPNIPNTKKDLVPKPLYDEQVALVADLTVQVNELNQEITDLNSQIQTLEVQIQTEINNRLTVEQTNDALSNQLASLSKTIEDFSNQIQSAVQKSVEESILRASLQSQNAGFKVQVEALIKQVDSLNSIIEGLQAQLGAVQQQQALQQSATSLAAATGGEVLAKIAIVDFSPVQQQKGWAKVQAKFRNKWSHWHQWEHGEALKIRNLDKQPIQIELSATFDSHGAWFKIPKTQYTIPAESEEEIKFIFTETFSYNYGGHSESFNGTFKVSIKRYDGSTDSKTWPTTIRVQHPDSY